MKTEYHIKISGVHYAANPEAEAGMPDTEAMHVRTRELLTKIDRERASVSLFAEPTNLYNPDCIMAFSKGEWIGRVADECVGEVKSLLAQSEDPILFARVEDVTIKEHGHLMVVVEAEKLTSILPLQSSAIEWDMWLKDDMMRLSPSKQVLIEKEAYYMLKRLLKTDIDDVDITDLKIYLGLWKQGSCHDLSRETREVRTQLISILEKSQRKEVRQQNEPLKQQRTSICGRMALIERASEWWTERLESEEMKRLWTQWWVANEGQLWNGLRDIDEKLRQLPGELYLDIDKREVVLSRLYYMNTPRKALDAILTLLMLRELICRHLGIEMKPMIETDYEKYMSENSKFSMKDLASSFLKFPTKIALGMYGGVSTLLAWHPEWQKHASKIEELILAQQKEQQDREEEKQDKMIEEVVKAANKKTNEFNVYPQAGSTANLGCQMQSPEFKVISPSEEQQPALESKNKENGR